MHYFALVLVEADVFDPIQQAVKLLGPFLAREGEICCPCVAFPSPTPCDVCEGTGIFHCDTNPASQFDWMVIGGRFDGMVSGQPPTNFKRLLDTMRSHAKPPVEQADGTVTVEFAGGLRGRFDVEVERMAATNVVRVSDLPDDLKCRAVITPDGLLFVEGFWGEGVSPAYEENWRREAKRLLDAHSDCLVVGVDLHV